MSENKKPFPCTSEGCDMTFTNEDHLNVHQKKHDMVLNLGVANKNNVFSDQTPTPTRFIRNCEEVGLFQDLQNVNPFDETFRKAAELVKIGNLPIHEASNDDTLHTPHIFPHIEENGKFDKQAMDICAREYGTGSVSDCDDLLKLEDKKNLFSKNGPVTRDLICSDNNIEVISLNDSNRVSSQNKLGETELESVTNHKSTVMSINVQTSKKTITLKYPKKSALLKNNNNLVKSVIENNKYELARKSNIECQQIFTLSSVNGSTIKINKPKKINRKENKSLRAKNSVDQERIREMNRAAQVRSRWRKRVLMNQMEEEVKTLKLRNKHLWQENQNLRKEILILKKMFLYHKDCSVSQDSTAMQEIIKVVEGVEIAGTTSNRLSASPDFVEGDGTNNEIEQTKNYKVVRTLIPKPLPVLKLPSNNFFIITDPAHIIGHNK